VVDDDSTRAIASPRSLECSRRGKGQRIGTAGQGHKDKR
jgi:hypothetical protein